MLLVLVLFAVSYIVLSHFLITTWIALWEEMGIKTIFKNEFWALPGEKYDKD